MNSGQQSPARLKAQDEPLSSAILYSYFATTYFCEKIYSLA